MNAGWSIDEIQNFSNFYNEFIEKNEPDFTVFMNFLKTKNFNKTMDELVEVYTKYKSNMPIKTNIDVEEKIEEKIEEKTEEKTEEKNEEKTEEKVEEKIEEKTEEKVEEKKEETKQKNPKNQLNGYKEYLKRLQNQLKNEKDPMKQAELTEKIKNVKEKIQTLTNLVDHLKAKHGTVDTYQRQVDMGRYYGFNQVENVNQQVQNEQNVKVEQTKPVQNNQPTYNGFTNEKDKKWMEKHKKGFILNRLEKKLNAKKKRNQDKIRILSQAARELQDAEFWLGRNNKDYQLIAKQYLKTQKEVLGRRISRKIVREIGKEYILKSGNHVEIPKALLNIVSSKTR